MSDAAPLQQSALYAAALSRLDVPIQQLRGPDGPMLVLMRHMPLLGCVALISRPQGRIDGDLRKTLGARLLLVNADSFEQGQHLAKIGFFRISPPRTHAHLSLAGGPEDWLARMRGKWRNRLRHGLRQGLELRGGTMPADCNHWLFLCEAAQQKARSYRNLPPALIAAMAAADPTALHLFTARKDGKTCAAMLFARHENSATYLIGWSDAAGRKTSAHPVLMWQAMADLHGSGVTEIDLGHCDQKRNPGLAHFKLGSGAAFRLLGGTWITAPGLELLRPRTLRVPIPLPPATDAPAQVERRGFPAP
ncbi:GNAT family N-acetyltransferase [Roseicyclus marinus]|uniref:GNAT family N-acetyltransferase n=1 Tax=Roseicyclus marinus TaxID=2161673 RepID=UPI0024106E8D|nr:GNAT family N-acetyltransferase [Roseicyclus marinus]MDG3040353.1 GNAT family N-acetyltransferase [Roseicyclus marinus]